MLRSLHLYGTLTPSTAGGLPGRPLKDLMTHVVTDACIKCKSTNCVGICPVDCFEEPWKDKTGKLASIHPGA